MTSTTRTLTLDFVHGSLPQFEGLSHEPNDEEAATLDTHPDLLGRYNRCELVLRQALLRASTEPEFAQLFSSTEEIEEAFGSPAPRIDEQKRLRILESVTPEEFQAEFIRRYGAVNPQDIH